MKWFSLIDENGNIKNVETGKVRAIIEGMTAEEIRKSFVPSILWFELETEGVEEGWYFDGESFTPPREPPPEPDPEPEPITRVTPRQIRLLLIDMELDEMVETAINSLQGKDKKKAQAEWEYANYIDRNNPLVEMIGQALQLSSEDMDNFFAEANKY